MTKTVIGVAKEIKNKENRVALTPAGVKALTARGHQVLIEKNAGLGSGFSDQEFQAEGAEIVDKENVFNDAELILKVKEPIKEEYPLLKARQTHFTYLHLASDKNLTEKMLEANCTGIAYETVEDNQGRLPLLNPMSAVAGRMAIQVGAHYLSKPTQGRGILLDGIPGVKAAEVVIIGAGLVGTNAAKTAAGRGANVTILDINTEKLAYLEDTLKGKVNTLYSNEFNLRESVKKADLVVGAVLLPGAKAPKLITEEMIKSMKQGSVIVDVCIDQGGCVETSKPTTHENPVFEKHGVIHYCVTNMPGAYPRTSTYGLTNATMPYVLQLANKGIIKALKENQGLRKGVNIFKGYITCQPVAEALNLQDKFKPIEELI